MKCRLQSACLTGSETFTHKSPDDFVQSITQSFDSSSMFNLFLPEPHRSRCKVFVNNSIIYLLYN